VKKRKEKNKFKKFKDWERKKSKGGVRNVTRESISHSRPERGIR